MRNDKNISRIHYTKCRRLLYDSGYVVSRWNKVTCKDCLKTHEQTKR